MASIITIAGEKLFAAKAQANEQLDIGTFAKINVSISNCSLACALAAKSFSPAIVIIEAML
ncbi:MAG: hypothetical protein AAF644_00795, partial [Pseudomonadota bacterium]